MTLSASILVIGNEILSGRTKDQNIAYIAQKLLLKGIKLEEVRIVPDEEHRIIEALNALKTRYRYVFTTGGIGATHDDITAASIAKAFNQPYALNRKAALLLKDYYKERLNPIRMRMAYMPQSAQLIMNPVSCAPGFYIENVYCMAGMPKIMQAMFDYVFSILETDLPISSKIVSCDLLEGDIANALEEIQLNYKDIAIGSYPFFESPTNVGVSFVIQGQNTDAIDKAYADVMAMIERFHGNLKFL